MSIYARRPDKRERAYENGTATIYQWKLYTSVDHPELHNCSECGIGSTYNGKSLVLQIDHIDGNCHHNVQSNFRWLCPNCHSQTETWGQKGRSLPKATCIYCKIVVDIANLSKYHGAKVCNSSILWARRLSSC